MPILPFPPVWLLFPCWFRSVCALDQIFSGPCSQNGLCDCDDETFSCWRVAIYTLGVWSAGAEGWRGRFVDVRYAPLEVLQREAFEGVSLETLTVSFTPMHTIEMGSFASSAATLRSLELSENALRHFPFTQLAVLRRLGALYIEFNRLTSLRDESGARGEWGGLRSSLVFLALNGNYLTHIEADAFTDLIVLQELHLANNRLRFVSPDSASSGSPVFDLRLGNNILEDVPCFSWPSLGLLSLEDNFLKRLPCRFESVRRLDLRRNSFRDSTLCSIYLKTSFTVRQYPIECWGDGMTLASRGLERIDEALVDVFNSSDRIRTLNIEHNYLKTLPDSFEKLYHLTSVFLAHNSFDSDISLPEKIEHLYLSGNMFTRIPSGSFQRLRSLNTLDLSRNFLNIIEEKDFFGWANRLTTLYLDGNQLVALERSTFLHSPMLHKIRLNSNKIHFIHPEAFTESHTSFRDIELSGNLLREIPTQIDQKNCKVEKLNIDNNDMDRLSAKDLDTYPRMKNLELQFNQITELEGFDRNCSTLPILTHLTLSFNYLSLVEASTFACFERLETIDLFKNRISRICKGAFSHFPLLDHIFLDNNIISLIENGAFQNLSYLQYLHLENNKLKAFSFNWFFNIAQKLTEPFEVNVSSNLIEELRGIGGASVGVLDLSFNKIVRIPDRYFISTGARMRQLIISHNLITEIGNYHLCGLRTLQRLDLSHNSIAVVKRKAFQDLVGMQILQLSHNGIGFVSPDMLLRQTLLRQLDLGSNSLNDLPAELLRNTILERFVLKNNSLMFYPSAALERVGFTLKHLDLSENRIERIDKRSLASTPFLYNFIMRNNSITDLSEDTFYTLEQAKLIDLSGNALRTNLGELFRPLTSLIYLHLENASLDSPPLLSQANLSVLKLGHNFISDLSDSFHSLPNLNELHLEYNRIAKIDEGTWSSLKSLIKLVLSGNLFTNLEPSYFNIPGLAELQLTDLNLISIEKDTFVPLRSLRSLRIETWPGEEEFRVASLLGLEKLSDLEIHVKDPVLDRQLHGLRASKLKRLRLWGTALTRLSRDALAGVECNKRLHLSITHTNVSSLPEGLFLRLGHTEKLSIDLSDNRFTSLDLTSFYPDAASWQRYGTKLVSGGLTATGNPMLCECNSWWASLWLRRWTRECAGSPRRALALTCIGPSAAPTPMLFHAHDRGHQDCAFSASAPVSAAMRLCLDYSNVLLYFVSFFILNFHLLSYRVIKYF